MKKRKVDEILAKAAKLAAVPWPHFNTQQLEARCLDWLAERCVFDLSHHSGWSVLWRWRETPYGHYVASESRAVVIAMAVIEVARNEATLRREAKEVAKAH